jgi:hypothetical protein
MSTLNIEIGNLIRDDGRQDYEGKIEFGNEPICHLLLDISIFANPICFPCATYHKVRELSSWGGGTCNCLVIRSPAAAQKMLLTSAELTSSPGVRKKNWFSIVAQIAFRIPGVSTSARILLDTIQSLLVESKRWGRSRRLGKRIRVESLDSQEHSQIPDVCG